MLSSFIRFTENQYLPDELESCLELSDNEYQLPIKAGDIIKFIVEKDIVGYRGDDVSELKIGLSSCGFIVAEDIGTVVEGEDQVYCTATIPSTVKILSVGDLTTLSARPHNSNVFRFDGVNMTSFFYVGQKVKIFHGWAEVFEYVQNVNYASGNTYITLVNTNAFPNIPDELVINGDFSDLSGSIVNGWKYRSGANIPSSEVVSGSLSADYSGTNYKGPDSVLDPDKVYRVQFDKIGAGVLYLHKKLSGSIIDWETISDEGGISVDITGADSVLFQGGSGIYIDNVSIKEFLTVDVEVGYTETTSTLSECIYELVIYTDAQNINCSFFEGMTLEEVINTGVELQDVLDCTLNDFI